MNIAINTLALYKTKVGMGKYIVELCTKIPKEDSQNKYLLYVSRENRKYFKEVAERENVALKEVRAVFISPVAKIVWEQCVLPFSLWKHKINLYHGLGFSLPVCMPKGVKSIVTIADMTFMTHAAYHTKAKQFYFQKMIPYAIKKADAVITISKNTKDDVLSLVPVDEKKIYPILLGVDDIFAVQNTEEVQKVKKKYSLETPYILFVGMLEPRKNIPGIIKAFAKIKEKKKHKLVIVGKKGWYYEEIFQAVEKYAVQNEVLFTGYVPDEDLPGLFSGATCFVYPSFYEGFGIPILEAMACGCPVITSNNSSMKEIAGDAALLVDPQKTEEITHAMVMLLENAVERKKRAESGKQQAKKFSWQKMTEETKKLYSSL